MYIFSLISVLTDSTKALNLRQLASIIFKNEIIPNEKESDDICSAVWFNLNEDTRNQAKEAFLYNMGSTEDEAQIRLISMCIAVVARVELPNA